MKTPTNDNNKTFKVIIAGSREFNDYHLLKEFCDKILINLSDIQIISGTAKGADKLGEKYAHDKGFKLIQVPADWSFGKKAGFIRNEKMAKLADGLIAFWDGESKGTKHMIEIAKKNNLKVKVYKFKKNGNEESV